MYYSFYTTNRYAEKYGHYPYEGYQCYDASACVSGTPLSVPQGHGDSYVPRGEVGAG